MKPSKRKKRKLKKRNMENPSKTFEGETHGEVEVEKKADQEILEAKYNVDGKTHTVKFTADPLEAIASRQDKAIIAQDKIIKKLTFQRNIAVLAALLFLILAL